LSLAGGSPDSYNLHHSIGCGRTQLKFGCLNRTNQHTDKQERGTLRQTTLCYASAHPSKLDRIEHMFYNLC